MRNDGERLSDILEAIERIEKYAVRGRSAFEKDELIQVRMQKNIEIIGEACRAVSSEFKDLHANVPWRQIIDMRHHLTHEYFGIDLEEVWIAVERDIPVLKQQVIDMLK